jgi:hypothetical protein
VTLLAKYRRVVGQVDDLPWNYHHLVTGGHSRLPEELPMGVTNLASSHANAPKIGRFQDTLLQPQNLEKIVGCPQ